MDAIKKQPFVLFVDDNTDILELLRQAGEMRGWRVETAETAEEMLEMINRVCAMEHTCYDLVVADINYFHSTEVMRLDGISALRQVRKKFPDIPFIILSAMLEPLTISEIKKLGAGYESKPFDIDVLFERAEEVMTLFSVPFTGVDRRKKSINLTNENRRLTDCPQLKVPKILRDAFQAARSMKTI